MTLEALREVLDEVPDLVVRPTEPLGRHNLLRVGGPVELWLVAETETAARAAAVACQRAGVKVRSVHGAHWLARDEGVTGACLVFGDAAWGLGRVDGGLEVGARHPVAALAAASARLGLSGLETLGGRPGTVAEALFEGRLRDVVDRIRVLRGTRVSWLGPDQLRENHHLLRVRLHLEVEDPEVVRSRTRLATLAAPGGPAQAMVDPVRQSAAGLILDTGLSGVRLRAVRVGRAEPNSLINLGGASARDVALVLAMIRDRVKLQTGIELRPHPPHLGRAPSARPPPRSSA